ncbi:flagellar biosynthesis protein FlhB [soil metagenome]
MSDLGEKTEAPTQRKLDDAREQGQVARSPDLAAPLDLIAAAGLFWFLGPMLVSACAEVVRVLLSPDAGVWLSSEQAIQAVSWSLLRIIVIAGPIMLLITLAAAAVQVQQVKLHLTAIPLMPKLERLNPIAGFQRLLSLRSAVKTTVSLIKLCVMLAVVWAVTRAHADELAILPTLGAVEAFHAMARIVLQVIAWILALMLALGVADWMYQKWQHEKDLRMTRQEIKDERKMMDGDPEMKARRQRIGREIAMQRAKTEVPKADVVITNPTHFAVALKYDQLRSAAPVVVAKGEDFMAFRIRELAAAHGIPIVERPPLARAIYANTKVGQQIKAELFEAVAEVLAYVYRLQKRKAG